MATNGGPKIPSDQLSFAIDASNFKSYPDSGDNWFDLGPYKLTLGKEGTQTPFTTADGVKCFQFNGSGYWESGDGHANVDMGGDCTLVFWMYAQDLTERDTIFEKAGTGGATSYQREIAMTLETNEAFSYYSRRSGNYDHAGTSAMTQNKWNLMSIKMSTGRTAASRTGFYSKNGAAYTANYNSRSNTALESGGVIRVGSGYAGPVENGYISCLYCYNKMLSNAEIAQFYNATKTRFNLS